VKGERVEFDRPPEPEASQAWLAEAMRGYLQIHQWYFLILEQVWHFPFLR
jgi:hypothetical protein